MTEITIYNVQSAIKGSDRQTGVQMDRQCKKNNMSSYPKGETGNYVNYMEGNKHQDSTIYGQQIIVMS